MKVKLVSPQTGILAFILLTVPIATIINQQVHNYQSAAHDKRTNSEKIRNSRLISGIIYEDSNENQIREDGEPGIMGVDVLAKYRSKNNTDDDDEDEDNGDRDRREKTWSEIKLLSGQDGLFRIELPKKINPRSSKFSLTVLPPSGYKLSETKFQYVKKQDRKKGERIIYIGLVRDALAPTATVSTMPEVTVTVSPTEEPDPTPTPTNYPNTAPSSTPTPELTAHPIMTPPIAPTAMMSLTPEPTLIATSPVPTSIVCPQPPVCDGGEVVVIEQPSLICPIYFCYSIDPGQ